jgi:hypothetical protein
MKTMKIAIATAALAITASPAFAVNEHANGHANSHADGSGSKARAYGKLCQDESKKHVKGEKGTPFSRCVTAMAKLDRGKADSPREACKDLSKKHVKGEKGTPFSRCVKAGHELEEGDNGGS